MTALILLRHGKSDWNDDLPDRQRPLADRGRRGAQTIGRFLARTGDLPDAVVTSPAERAVQTLRLVIEAAGWAGQSGPITESDRLYGEGVDGLLAVVGAQPESVDLLLAVGHEPTWSEAVGVLCGGLHVRMPTAAMARIDFDDVSWSEIEPGAGLLTWLVTPKILG